MTFRETIFSQTGYECKTTFPEDFAIAEHFGVSAIRDTFNRAFNEWKTNTVYLTELVIVLNWKIWQWYEENDKFGRLYDELWRTADEYACEHLKGEDAEYYFRVTD